MRAILKCLVISIMILIGICSCKTMPNLEKSCQLQCLADFRYCEKICDDNCPDCCSSNRAMAIISYKRYANECEVLGKPPSDWLQYYHDPLKCNKNSCSCQDDLLLCKQHCVGKIYKRLKTSKYC